MNAIKFGNIAEIIRRALLTRLRNSKSGQSRLMINPIPIFSRTFLASCPLFYH